MWVEDDFLPTRPVGVTDDAQHLGFVTVGGDRVTMVTLGEGLVRPGPGTRIRLTAFLLVKERSFPAPELAGRGRLVTPELFPGIPVLDPPDLTDAGHHVRPAVLELIRVRDFPTVRKSENKAHAGRRRNLVVKPHKKRLERRKLLPAD